MNEQVEWISCEDKLPGRYETVLIVVLSHNGYGDPVYYVTIGSYHHVGHKWLSFTGSIHPSERVTHWMPLPNPPELRADEIEDEGVEK